MDKDCGRDNRNRAESNLNDTRLSIQRNGL